MLSVVATLEHRKTCHCRQMQGPARKSRATVDSSAAESTYMVKNYAPMVELVDTLVLEASAQASEFESRLGHQIRKCGRVRFIATVLKTVVSKGTVSSNLTASAKNWSVSSVG